MQMTLSLCLWQVSKSDTPRLSCKYLSWIWIKIWIFLGSFSKSCLLSYLEKKNLFFRKILIRIKPISIQHTVSIFVTAGVNLLLRFEIWNVPRRIQILGYKLVYKVQIFWNDLVIYDPCHIFSVSVTQKNQNVRSKSQIAAVTETFFRTPSSWPQHVKTKLS